MKRSGLLKYVVKSLGTLLLGGAIAFGGAGGCKPKKKSVWVAPYDGVYNTIADAENDAQPTGQRLSIDWNLYKNYALTYGLTTERAELQSVQDALGSDTLESLIKEPGFFEDRVHAEVLAKFYRLKTDVFSTGTFDSIEDYVNIGRSLAETQTHIGHYLTGKTILFNIDTSTDANYGGMTLPGDAGFIGHRDTIRVRHEISSTEQVEEIFFIGSQANPLSDNDVAPLENTFALYGGNSYVTVNGDNTLTTKIHAITTDTARFGTFPDLAVQNTFYDFDMKVGQP